jgi:hypothetical protein
MTKVVQKLGGYSQFTKYKRIGNATPSLRRRIAAAAVVVVVLVVVI